LKSTFDISADALALPCSFRMSRRLSELPVGGKAVIAQVGGLRPVRRRLMELGLVPGTAVEVVNIAPLGDPMELEVRGCKLSIRHTEAAEIALTEAIALPVAEKHHLKVVA
jgi:ferrous iron transport protein A